MNFKGICIKQDFIMETNSNVPALNGPTAKYFGVVYNVRPTGTVARSKAKSYTDFNGYEVDKPASIRIRLGLYHPETGELFATLGNDGKSLFSGSGKSFGQVTVKESIEALNKQGE